MAHGGRWWCGEQKATLWRPGFAEGITVRSHHEGEGEGETMLAFLACSNPNMEHGVGVFGGGTGGSRGHKQQ